MNQVNESFEISNLLIDDTTSASSGSKYLIKTSSVVKKDTRIPLNIGNFINIYIGKEHIETCTAAYEEMKKHS